MGTTVQKFAMGLIAIGMAVALTLPERQTVPVADAFTRLVTRSMGTAMGTYKPTG